MIIVSSRNEAYVSVSPPWPRAAAPIAKHIFVRALHISDRNTFVVILWRHTRVVNIKNPFFVVKSPQRDPMTYYPPPCFVPYAVFTIPVSDVHHHRRIAAKQFFLTVV